MFDTILGCFAYFFVLLFFHALADYPLQGEFLAQGKNRHTELGKDHWYILLPMHAMIHAGFVFLATMGIAIYFGLPYVLLVALIYGVFEFMSHCLIDDAKCNCVISFREDQFRHICMKFGYALGILLSVVYP